MINIKDDAWVNLKQSHGSNKFIFMTRSGYRHFFVLGKDLHNAEENFMRIDEIKRCGFSIIDLPIRLEYTKEVKNFTIEEFWNHRENKE